MACIIVSSDIFDIWSSLKFAVKFELIFISNKNLEFYLNTKLSANPDYSFDKITLISVRRFICRPASVSLPATGFDEPRPMV